MAAPFRIEEDQEGNVRILSLHGSLDGHSFVELETHLDALLGKGTTHLVIDLEHLQYIASAGVGILINCLRRATSDGGNVILLRPLAIVKEVFDLLGLSSLFTIVEDRSEAVDQAAKGAA